jgi:hypothetical protein
VLAVACRPEAGGSTLHTEVDAGEPRGHRSIIECSLEWADRQTQYLSLVSNRRELAFDVLWLASDNRQRDDHMRATIAALLVLLISSAANADVNWTVPAGTGKSVNVTLPGTQASAVRSLVGKLQSANVQWYANFWQTTPLASSRAYPMKNGVALVAAVTSRNASSWMDQIGKQSIGMMCQGTPTEPHQTGEVRIGDLFFNFSTVNRGGTPTKMSSYFSDQSMWGGKRHCENTIPVTNAELAAFKAFYLARANGAIVDRAGQPIRPEFDSNGSTKYGKTGWVEGCSAASSSALDRHWTTAFRASVSNIQAVGRRMNIPEMANATADMAATIESLAGRLGLRQECSPQGMVRRGVYANKERVGMMTILNDSNTPTNLALHNQWDQKYADANREAWSGMAPVTIIPDLPSTSRGAKTFVNTRVTDRTTLDQLFRQIP